MAKKAFRKRSTPAKTRPKSLAGKRQKKIARGVGKNGSGVDLKRRPPRVVSKQPKTRRQAKPASLAPDNDGQPIDHFDGDGETLMMSDAAPNRRGDGAAFSIVGVGASAGGLEAFSQLLEHLPASLDMAVVLVPHLAPDHESVLHELLQTHSKLSVAQVTDRTKIEPNHVYIIPPNTVMTIEDGRFVLKSRPENRVHYLPIDVFFRSLAHYAEHRAIGVVLSGTASDGASGLSEIKASGGIAIAQEPRSAQYDGMPRAAIATGEVDLVLSPTEIAAELVRLSRMTHVPGRFSPAIIAGASFPDEQLNRIFGLLRRSSGVDFSHYKQPTIRRRLHRRMVLHKIDSLPEYVRLLQKDPEEVSKLYQDILIHVTRFFREPDSFETLANTVFPWILKHRRDDDTIRIWVPGCATGEEAYSVAMALLEFLGDEADSVPMQIFATDVSETAIEHARAGLYRDHITTDVSVERLRRFFTKTDGSFRVNKKLRDHCIFARQDLTRDPPFSRLDLIVCRNVLIYLDQVFQRKLMGVFHYALKPTGFLMLGMAETVGTSAEFFAVTDKRHRLYTKKGMIGPDHVRFREPPHADHAGIEPKAKAIDRSATTLQTEANRAVLDHYAPPSVIVNEDLEIVQFRGQTGTFLEPAPGDATLNILKMAREGLLHSLRKGLNDVRRSGRAYRATDLNMKLDGHGAKVDLRIMPIEGAAKGRHYLVNFEMRPGNQDGRAFSTTHDGTPETKRRKGSAKASKSDENRQLSQLRQELAANREYLQSIIQDVEAANEELQSANEEVLSSNEELQSTNEELDTAKEELQSTNEELNTVNEELHARNEELMRVNSDLVNLLGSVQIAIVMVAGDLRIRRFTPMAERVLNLIPTDVGRPISDLKPNIDCPDLERLIVESVDTVTLIEREVRDRNGNLFSLRIRPYKDIEQKIDGAVLSLVEINAERRHDQDIEAARDYAREIIESLPQSAVLLDEGLRVMSANKAFAEKFSLVAEQAWDQHFYDLGGGMWNIPSLRPMLEEVLPREKRLVDVEIEHDFTGTLVKRIRLNARRVQLGKTSSPMVLLLIDDLTTREVTDD